MEQIVKTKTPKKKVNYLDNEKFKQALIDYNNACKKAKKEKKPEPKIPEYLGECFYLIAFNLAKAGNFSGYSFKEEMIMDGVENCLQYFRNYDPNKVKSNPNKPGNAHAYFTQIVFFAFVRRINKEKKQSYIKAKLTENYAVFEHTDQYDENGTGQQFEMYDNIAEKIVDYETKVEEKKARRRRKSADIEALPVENEDE